MPLPTVQDLAIALSSTPEQFEQYLDKTYPQTADPARRNPPMPDRRMGDVRQADANLNSSTSGMGDVRLSEAPIGPDAQPVSSSLSEFPQPTEAERIAEVATVPTMPDSGWAAPEELLSGLDVNSVAGRQPAQGVALVDAQGRPNAAGRAAAAGAPPPSVIPALQPAAASPAGAIAPASSITSGMSVTPNYYLGSGSGIASVPAGTAGATPVSYGIATGGAAPAGTVTPSGNVTTGAAPAAGAVGGGGTAPSGAGMGAASGIASAIQGLGSAAAGYIAASATPQPMMQQVQPVLADFPLIPIQQKPPILG